MATYRLSSLISPVGHRGHRVSVTAIAPGRASEEVVIEIVDSIVDAERRRCALLALLEDHLRRRGHEVADLVED